MKERILVVFKSRRKNIKDDTFRQTSDILGIY